LAAIGLYGVTAYTVAQRTQEIGIRMQLGADRINVVQMVLAGASRRLLVGLVLGVPLAIGAGRLISAQLYGVSSWDPMALGIAAIGACHLCMFCCRDSVSPRGHNFVDESAKNRVELLFAAFGASRQNALGDFVR
jgi:ABC-type antimicrobial peptide transport system permease subunit